MKTSLSVSQRMLMVIFFFVVAVIGFMVKLPPAFRHIDKELHAAFYFLAAAILNVLFAKTKLIKHIVIFGSLYLFGIAIEFAQAYSNQFFHKRIHGRFDPEDVRWNLKGLALFSMLWLICAGFILIYKRRD
ncbi:MAG: hypothetical protein EOO14_01660 [Chitinophagaceae bacterium]|nr:MAG: hypothetical protein EOO14_01660 [Chitinophagaceae bacterium]